MISDIQFLDFVITNIDYKATPIDNEKENNFEFAYGLNEKDDIYTLSLLTKIISLQEDHKLKITLETKGRFKFVEDCNLSNEQKIAIVKTNGSAIVFPYIRSLIYNITSADTHGKAVILPTINFTKVIEEIDNNPEQLLDNQNEA